MAQNALAKVVEFIHLSKNGEMNNNNCINVELGWTPPPANWFKLNVDDSYMENPGVMAAAGADLSGIKYTRSCRGTFDPG
ncbi:4-diphosphocytidyl-2-C-methyl-D-erythritol kinase, chloroplastic [Senna tora]|uniref:4-diphosphocytidyl-2-C-methyl-D-erythritol kinase, chloroplastic n=1 Tax=Senna tora TaxID=362788 RepID=A0A834TC05_9FABA|nr:4-diphosphocytidyl-2-C-methyl-D-erythritol kinase, chloroplastic [Senna tora]